MEPKAIRFVSKPKVLEAPYKAENAVDPADGYALLAEAPTPVKKSVQTYEERLEKMSDRQLRGEVRKGIKGKHFGYNSVVTCVVLDVLLESFDRGMTTFVR
jgi:hypothetical protein